MIKIKVGDKIIGEVETLIPKEASNESANEIKCSRVRFDKEHISKAFNNRVSNLTQHTPLNIPYEDENGNQWVLENCWVSNYNFFEEDNQGDDIFHIEEINFEYENKKEDKND